ncbi:MAG: T9SS type A sorting domain-containing protein, partial [candidate division Zixibacteria bacterium]|nr:T9SS type A sorting domain-containing protein [candidate division Zixibacteria bacterium]
SADGYCIDFRDLQLSFRADTTAAEWEIIARRSVPAYDDVLLYWLLSGLEAGGYYLRLSLLDTQGLVQSDSIRVHVQSLFDTKRAWLTEIGEQSTIVPNYGDFDNDGNNEIIIGTLTGIHVYNLDGTPKTDGIPDFPFNTFTTPIAVGNLDGDGVDDIVAMGYEPPFLYGWPSSGEPFINHLGLYPTVSYFNNNTENRFPKVFLKDLDSDNRDEIHVYIYDSEVPRALMFDSDGSLLHRFDYVIEYLPADLDGDGLDEIYTMPRRYGMLRRLDAIKGVTLDSLLITINGSDYICQGLSACDIDHDLKPELIVFGYYYDFGYWLYAFDENLQLKDGWPHDMGMNSYIVPTVPVFGDIDRDGTIEYFTGYFDLDYSYVYAWNIDGTPYLSGSPAAFFAQTPQVSYMNMLLLADMNGDGDAEVVACANNDAFFTYKVQRVYAWDKHGEVLPGFPIVTSQDVTSYYRYIPTIGDMNGDGCVDLTMTTPDHNIAFVNFPDATYDPCLSPSPHWRYDRAMSNVMMPSCNQTDVDDGGEGRPESFHVAQNYPNPFNPTTVITYSLPSRSAVTVTVFDILGRTIRTLTDQVRTAGTHREVWDGTDSRGRAVASGIYFYRVKTEGFVETRKMILLK